MVSEVNVAGKTIVTYNLHLESRDDEPLRCAQLDEALKDAQRYNSETPVLLTGDFNLDAPEGPAATAISRAQFQDAFATGTRRPHLAHSWSVDESSIGF